MTSSTTQELVKGPGTSTVTVSKQQNDNSWRSVLSAIPGILVCITILAVLTGSLYFWRFGAIYESDSSTYIIPAANLLAGHGFTDARGNPETLRPPGYPLIILPFLRAGLDLKYLVLAQHLLRVLLILATTAFAFRLTRERMTALLVGVLLCIDTPLLASANSVLTELCFTVVLGIALALLWAGSRDTRKSVASCGLAGLLAGAAVLIRPIGLFLFVAIAVYLFFAYGRFKWRAISVFVLAFLCLPIAWAARNRNETGFFTVSSISGLSMLQYRAAGILALNDHGDLEVQRAKHAKELEGEACRQFKRDYGRDCSQLSAPERSEYFSQFGRKFVLQHKVAYLKLAVRGAAMMMLTANLVPLTGIKGLGVIFTLPALVFALVGLKPCWTSYRSFFWLAVLVIAYFVAVSAGAEAYSRFRVPIVPLYCILSAMGLNYALTRFSRAKKQG
jgi:hypothetical protein